MFVERVIYCAEEAVPEPGVVFGGKIRSVVWRLVGRRGSEEHFWWALGQDGEELRACVGWEGDVWYGRGVSEGGRNREGGGKNEGEAGYLQSLSVYRVAI